MLICRLAATAASARSVTPYLDPLIRSPGLFASGRPRRCAARPAQAIRHLQTDYAASSSASGSLEQPREGVGSTSTSPLPLVLRSYQSEAIQACLDAIQSGLTRIGVSSPTGSGKTTMFMHLIPQFMSKSASQEGRGRTLILVPSVELASQAEAAAKRLLGPRWTIEVEQAARRASGRADVTIATFQTLNNVDRLRKFDPRLFKLVIVDEAHHAAALTYMRILQYFNEGVQLPDLMSPVTSSQHGQKVPIVGFSATFSRPDQLALSAVFEKIVYHREILSMLDDGWLAPVKSTAVKCNLGLNKVELSPTGDFNANSLANQVNTPAVNDLIVRTYLHRAPDRRSTLVFCVDLKHVADLTNAFRTAGVDARSISSLSHPRRRRDTIEAFSSGHFPVLINCEVLTEGTDIPEIDCIILARPTKSKNLLAQMVGRGLRLSPQTHKDDCYLIDIVDNVSRSNGMLVSPTLWGLSHDDLPPARRGIRDVMEEEDQADEDHDGAMNAGGLDENAASAAKVTYVDQDDPFRLRVKVGMPLSMMSRNAWVFCGRDRYVLELLDQGYVLVEPAEVGSGAAWIIGYRQKLPAYLGVKVPYSSLRKIALADTLERALQTADAFTERKMGRQLYQKLSRYASWRYRPASSKAVEMLSRMKIQMERRDTGDISHVVLHGKDIPLARLTAGDVSAYLCAASHGATAVKKRLDSAERTAKKRRAARELKAEQLAQRNLPLPGQSG